MGLVQSIADRFSQWHRSFSGSPKDERHALGRRGEKLAAGYLRRQGYKVLYRNFRAPHGGEVDIVCRDKAEATLVFVEVKTRSSMLFGSPAEAVGSDKQHLITRGALAWLRMLDNPDVLFRFDIVEIVMTDERPSFNLIRNAFPLPKPHIY